MNSTLWGVIIGGAIGLISGLSVALLNMWNDHMKWRREQSIRYNNHRIEVYAAFVADGEHIGRGELKDGDTGRMARFLLNYQKILMLSSDPVKMTATAYIAAVTAFFRLYTEKGASLPNDAPSSLYNAEVAFTKEVSAELEAR